MIIKQDGKMVASVARGCTICKKTGKDVQAMDKFVFAISREGTNGRLYSGGVAEKGDKNFIYNITELCAWGGLVNFSSMIDFARERNLALVDNFAGNQVMISD